MGSLGKGPECIFWKGGKPFISNMGYVLIYVTDHPKAQHGRVQEHRWVMEQHLGRYLKSHEIIHHINGNKQDNRLENLELTTRSKHPSHHIKDLTYRFCLKCKRKTYVRKNGVEEWYRFQNGFECRKCHRIYLGSIGVPHGKR